MTTHRNLLRDPLESVADHVLSVIKQTPGSKVLQVRSNGKLRVWDAHKARHLDGASENIGHYYRDIPRQYLVEDLDDRLREITGEAP